MRPIHLLPLLVSAAESFLSPCKDPLSLAVEHIFFVCSLLVRRLLKAQRLPITAFRALGTTAVVLISKAFRFLLVELLLLWKQLVGVSPLMTSQRKGEEAKKEEGKVFEWVII